jgi:hypothetical protein
MKQFLTLCLSSLLLFTACGSKNATPKADDTTADTTAVAQTPNVYFTRDISPAGLQRVYEAVLQDALARGIVSTTGDSVVLGRNVAVKLSTGEPGGHNYLQPALIADLVHRVGGTIVECNTAYGGGRANTEDHLKAARDHGFTEIAPVDIMDADSAVEIPVANGKHLQADLVGSHLLSYDFVLVLSHFKGHAMGGFGGAIKNISIGIASSAGKHRIHSAGKVDANCWQNLPAQDDFLESMAEAAQAVVQQEQGRLLYINVMNRLSVDCDCDSHPAEPEMMDIGIMASVDPVAVDRASVDRVYAAPEEERKALVERIESRHGTHTLDYAAEIGLGSLDYTLVDLDAR